MVGRGQVGWQATNSRSKVVHSTPTTTIMSPDSDSEKLSMIDNDQFSL
jgi:hypothetical protein